MRNRGYTLLLRFFGKQMLPHIAPQNIYLYNKHSIEKVKLIDNIRFGEYLYITKLIK